MKPERERAWSYASMNDLEIARAFKKPLIIGASVSADLRGPSPGRILSMRYTDEKSVQTIAERGKKCGEIIERIRPDVLNDRSIVIGVDLFFWDSFAESCHNSIAELHRLYASLSKQQIPLVLGDVPALVPTLQPSRPTLNRALSDLAHLSNVYIVSLDQIYADIVLNGSIYFEGRLLKVEDLTPDGLHFSYVASRYIADAIFNVLSTERSQPNFLTV